MPIHLLILFRFVLAETELGRSHSWHEVIVMVLSKFPHFWVGLKLLGGGHGKAD